MIRLVPRALVWRLALLLVLAVVAAQAAAFAMFASEATRVGRAAGRTQVIDRIAILVRLLDTVPADAVPGTIAAFNSPRHHFSIGQASLVPDGAMDADEARLAHGLDRRLQADASEARLLLVKRDLVKHDAVKHDSVERDVADAPGAEERRAKPEALQVSVHLADGRWLNGEAPVALPTPPWMRIGLFQIAASVVAVLVAVGLGLRGVVGPVTALAQAAEEAGRGTLVAPLPEPGPAELKTMTIAFNRMQARLRAYVDDRTRMLAAVSHDLRTPIASLWLRAEMVEDEALRAGMVRTLGDMKRMVEATLSFARDDAASQASGPLDLTELARTLVSDHVALGRDVTLSAPETLPFAGRPDALRRALDNLVENAVRYGARARIALDRDGAEVRIRVEDDGPGIPADRVEAMFEPFARLDDSRNDETGGTGLGLAIARSAIRAHGGEIRLATLPQGGLRAEIVLPGAEG
ncbi:HAMP domain-containing protein [Methylobacterium sp. WL12]|uniref:ATP-binding protein n=1 Tax=Methylobacterium sp. WL12 TaxID=2603890 RepID=UPI0011CC902A|nr:ATP-binding protein [Methylobacterium sp. WL12]TXM72947.1 HAMP domain-containing protein [Methylobacterium sp. WL12]